LRLGSRLAAGRISLQDKRQDSRRGEARQQKCGNFGAQAIVPNDLAVLLAARTTYSIDNIDEELTAGARTIALDHGEKAAEPPKGAFLVPSDLGRPIILGLSSLGAFIEGRLRLTMTRDLAHSHPPTQRIVS
jgi:hypothetical protein